jgi:cobalt-zinc-cadmium efflux system protein
VWSLDGEHHVFTAHLVTERPLNAVEYKGVKQAAGEIVTRYGFFHSTIELEWPEETCRIGNNHCH